MWTNAVRLWMIAGAVGAAYAYELRSGDEIVATGRVTPEHELAPGDELTVAGIVTHVEEVTWANGERRLVLEPRAASATP